METQIGKKKSERNYYSRDLGRKYNRDFVLNLR